MGLLIRGGRVIDPASGGGRLADVLIEGERIAAVESNLSAAHHRVIDAGDLIVAPGLVDMHAHLCDPGQTHREDIASGTAAAVRGGFTSLASMPNTMPPLDHPAIAEYIRSRARQSGSCRVHPVGAMTKGLGGDELAPIAGLAAAGVVALSDNAAVSNAGLLRHAMSYASMFDLPIIEHCEDPALSDGGVMHDGEWSTLLGLRGIPAASEAVIVARDLLLAEATGTRLHIAHVSAAGSVRLIREAKRRGVRVTAAVTPHHLVLTEEAVRGFDANAKTNPPLRSFEDRAALVEGLVDGTIDVIASDHTPVAPEEKMVEFDRAPFGVIGLETALGVVLTTLVRPGVLTLPEALAKLSVTPAAILGLKTGDLSAGALADLILIDLRRTWTVDASIFASKSRNTPFEGWTLQGKAVLTLVGGEIKYHELAAEVLA